MTGGAQTSTAHSKAPGKRGEPDFTPCSKPFNEKVPLRQNIWSNPRGTTAQPRVLEDDHAMQQLNRMAIAAILDQNNIDVEIST